MREPPELYRWTVGIPLLLPFYFAVFVIKVCNFIIWWRWPELKLDDAIIR